MLTLWALRPGLREQRVGLTVLLRLWVGLSARMCCEAVHILGCPLLRILVCVLVRILMLWLLLVLKMRPGGGSG